MALESRGDNGIGPVQVLKSIESGTIKPKDSPAPQAASRLITLDGMTRLKKR
jgi:hypothetical protein